MKLTPFNAAVFVVKTYISLVMLVFGFMLALVVATMALT